MPRQIWVDRFAATYAALAGASIKQSRAIGDRAHGNAFFLRPSEAAMLIARSMAPRGRKP